MKPKLFSKLSALFLSAIIATATLSPITASAGSALDKARAMQRNTSMTVSDIKGNIDSLHTDSIAKSVAETVVYERASEDSDPDSDDFMEMDDDCNNSLFSKTLLIPIFGIVFGVTVPFGTFALIIFFVLRSTTERKRLKYDAIARAAEAGHPLPPEFYNSESRLAKNKLQSGLVWMGWGAALIGLTLTGVGSAWWAIGLIPIFIGLSRIAVFFVEKKDKSVSPASESNDAQ